MADAKSAGRRDEPCPSPALLRDRARRRRETAARLLDVRLERLLTEEAEALERRADALELQAAIRVEADSSGDAAETDLAALRGQPERR
ncbi:MAG TPA: hypothetical protein VGL83_17565 [Stellaceae bacterium]